MQLIVVRGIMENMWTYFIDIYSFLPVPRLLCYTFYSVPLFPQLLDVILGTVNSREC